MVDFKAVLSLFSNQVSAGGNWSWTHHPPPPISWGESQRRPWEEAQAVRRFIGSSPQISRLLTEQTGPEQRVHSARRRHEWASLKRSAINRWMSGAEGWGRCGWWCPPPPPPFCLFLLSPECLEDERIRGRMETKEGRVTLQRCLCENAMNEFRHGGGAYERRFFKRKDAKTGHFCKEGPDKVLQTFNAVRPQRRRRC